jgi:hypothetical protein
VALLCCLGDKYNTHWMPSTCMYAAEIKAATHLSGLLDVIAGALSICRLLLCDSESTAIDTSIISAHTSLLMLLMHSFSTAVSYTIPTYDTPFGWMWRFPLSGHVSPHLCVRYIKLTVSYLSYRVSESCSSQSLLLSQRVPQTQSEFCIMSRFCMCEIEIFTRH